MNYTPLNFFGIIFCMMVGTASLPHILMRYFTTPSVKQARDSVAWSLLFIFLLYFSAPAYAAFSKLEVYTNIIGRDLSIHPAVAVHLGRARPDQDLRRGCRQSRCGHRRVQEDREPSWRPAVPGLLDQHRRDRAVDAGDRGPSLRDLGPGGRRRSCRRALHRRRPAARDRQRAQPRRLLQDDPAAGGQEAHASSSAPSRSWSSPDCSGSRRYRARSTASNGDGCCLAAWPCWRRWSSPSGARPTTSQSG